MSPRGLHQDKPVHDVLENVQADLKQVKFVEKGENSRKS